MPETQPELVQQNVTLSVEDKGANVFDAAAKGVQHGTNIAVQVITMVAFAIGFMALCNHGLGKFLELFHMHAQIQDVLGVPFMPIAWLMGVPWHDCMLGGRLMATELPLQRSGLLMGSCLS